MTLGRVPYGAILETVVPAIGFARGSTETTRVVSLTGESLSTSFEWLEVVDLMSKPPAVMPLDVEIPGLVLGERGTWVAVCSQLRPLPRSRLRPGHLGVLPEPHLSRVRAAVRLLLDL